MDLTLQIYEVFLKVASNFAVILSFLSKTDYIR